MMSSQYRKVRRQTSDHPPVRIFPRNINQDKEVLYYESIKLKRKQSIT